MIVMEGILDPGNRPLYDKYTNVYAVGAIYQVSSDKNTSWLSSVHFRHAHLQGMTQAGREIVRLQT